jgi:hypothetical protein
MYSLIFFCEIYNINKEELSLMILLTPEIMSLPYYIRDEESRTFSTSNVLNNYFTFFVSKYIYDMINIMAQEKVKFYFTFFFAIRGDESRTFSTSNIKWDLS